MSDKILWESERALIVENPEGVLVKFKLPDGRIGNGYCFVAKDLESGMRLLKENFPSRL